MAKFREEFEKYLDPTETTSLDQQAKYFIQMNGKGWLDVPREHFERRCGYGFPSNPFDTLDFAQLVIETLYEMADDYEEYRIVCRPVLTKE